ncbi:MAG: peptidoglycan DD-metalloendopeptidase family protein [Ginsengibacter sp.]
MQRKIVSVLVFIFFIISATAQSQEDKDALQKQREKLKQEIAATEKTLAEVRKTAKVNLGGLTLINKKIDLQGNVIDNISGEIKNLNDNIFLSQKEVAKMSHVLDTLKQEYAKSMVYAYKNRSNYDFLNFIFSAGSFNDAIKRIAYLKSYRSYREMQAENILRTQQMLEDRIKILSVSKNRKNVVLGERDKELSQLEKQQQEKQAIVTKIKGQQNELTAQVNAKRKQDSKLKNMISAMIRREIEIARAEAAKKEKERLNALKNNNAATNNTTSTNNSASSNSKTTSSPAERKPSKSVLVTTDADRALDASFERNRGSLPWPAAGYIMAHFGANELPGGIDYENPGVTIGAKIGESVKAVFDGEVTLVSYIGDNQAVFLKHGKYFTVYSNLGSASVKKGDVVKTGEVIGKAGTNDQGQGQVDFILMKESNNINPEQWLRK